MFGKNNKCSMSIAYVCLIKNNMTVKNLELIYFGYSKIILVIS